MRSTREKAELCRLLHAGPEPVLSASCWDVGTACLLEHVGVPLLDTTSFGAMAVRGLPDAVGLASREFMLDNARLIAAAVDLPVQADLENGFGDSPDAVALTIREAATTGIVGGSIEDATGRPHDPIIRSRWPRTAFVSRPMRPARCRFRSPSQRERINISADARTSRRLLGAPKPFRRRAQMQSWCRA